VSDTPKIQLDASLSSLISDPSTSSPIFMPVAVPAATLPIYPGLGQTLSMLACIPSGLVFSVTLLILAHHLMGQYCLICFAGWHLSSSSSVMLPAVWPTSHWTVERPTLHGRPVRLCPVMATTFVITPLDSLCVSK